MRPVQLDRRRSDQVIAILVMTFALAALYLTLSFDPPVLPGFPGAAFFPRLVLGTLFVFGTLLAARAWRRDAQRGQGPGPTIDLHWGPIVLGSLSALGTAGLMQFAGFEIACALFIGGALLLRSGRWFVSALAAFLTVGLMYAVFVLLLQVHLPLLFLPRYY